MATEPPTIDIGQQALIKLQLDAFEIAMYQMADLINRIMRDKIAYTQVYAHTLEVPSGG